jgi:hypothetical protein
VAVNLAIPTSLLMLVAACVHLFRMLSFLLGRRASPPGRPLLTMIVFGFCGAFFANIVVFLPFVRYAYHFGYWQARLVMPALLGFCLLGFVLLDERLRSGRARATLLTYTVVQAALHASFLWVRGPQGKGAILFGRSCSGRWGGPADRFARLSQAAPFRLSSAEDVDPPFRRRTRL